MSYFLADFLFCVLLAILFTVLLELISFAADAISLRFFICTNLSVLALGWLVISVVKYVRRRNVAPVMNADHAFVDWYVLSGTRGGKMCRLCETRQGKFYECQGRYWCMDCMEDWLFSGGSQHPPGAATLVYCMDGCGTSLTPATLRNRIPGDLLSRYTDALTKTYVHRQPDTMWCSCGEVYFVEKSWWSRGPCMVPCAMCSRVLCLTCKSVKRSRKKHVCEKFEYHGPGFSCPGCGVIIEKTGGCVDMACSFCNYRFIARQDSTGKYRIE